MGVTRDLATCDVNDVEGGRAWRVARFKRVGGNDETRVDLRKSSCLSVQTTEGWALSRWVQGGWDPDRSASRARKKLNESENCQVNEGDAKV